MNEELVECPFCGEKGFDHVGLKLHLTVLGWCNVFDSINVLNQVVPRNEMKDKMERGEMV